MDLGGRPANLDLTEASRLMMPPAAPASVPAASQIQPPPFSMMMQQAVAMQQFQFQQALLMQQVMASQQAAARAANVKSAAEVAAARAAEITKQLKGNDMTEEPVASNPAVTSPNRSKSASRSRSASRSKSRSPIRYRRDRSVSRSPIRYRRDRLSPSRSRDYYGYRSRSRRGFYRGRGDYPWNPYRRDWDRDRDRDRDRDYHARPRRSRSRSRSRARRRSRTHSRSPRHRREWTPSPRHRRDERKGARDLRRSRSKELKRSPSGSTRSRSGSLDRKDISPSPKAQKELDSEMKETSIKSEIDSPMEHVQSPKEHASPEGKVQSDELDTKVDGFGKGLLEDGSPERDTSISPVRSLSVSLSPTPRPCAILDQVPSTKPVEPTKDQSWATVKPSSNVSGLATVGEVKSQGRDRCSPEKALEGLKGFKVSLRLKGSKQNVVARQNRLFKRAERDSKDADLLPDYESEENKGIDDWRDDMKAPGWEKTQRRENKDLGQNGVLEPKTNVARGRVSASLGTRSLPLAQQEESSLDLSRGLRGDSDAEEGDKQERGLPKVSAFPLKGSNATQLATGDVWEPKLREAHVAHNAHLDAENARGNVGKVKVACLGEKDSPPIKGALVANDRETEHYQDTEDDSVLEGPKPGDEYVATVEPPEGLPLSEQETDDQSLQHRRSKVAETGGDHKRDSKGRYRRNLEDDDSEREKVRERSKAREGKRHKDDDRRKERHRKHKRKHRREEVTVDEDYDALDDEGRKEKRRHKKKHKKEEEDARKERKKKKHKHKTKSMSLSPGTSPLIVVGEADDVQVSPVVHKKSSSRLKKRRRGPAKISAQSSISSD